MFEHDPRSQPPAGAEMLSQLPPGPALADVLARLEPHALGGYDLVDYIKASERQIAWTTANQLRAIAELSGRRPLPLGDGSGSASDRLPAGQINEFVDLEISAALRLSRASAGNRLDLALRLRDLPALEDALRAGSLDLPRARVIAEGVARLDGQLAAAVVDRLLVRAPDETALLRRSTERAVQAADPVGAEEAHQHAVDERRVVLTRPSTEWLRSGHCYLPTTPRRSTRP